ncbi:unnamed protein product [Leptosia nina]|uniref:Gag-like protein n=1 Tax=Leptosia nina TaxID=320188 RepID=A0AAV1JD79_9NEOP
MPPKHKKKTKKLENALRECHVSTPQEKIVSSVTFSETLQCDPKKWPKLKDKVPDIFLHEPVNFLQHVKKLLLLGIEFYRPHKSRYYTKITCRTHNDHKAMVQYFDKKMLPYHTFSHPSKRKMKIVIKGLPNEVDIDKLKTEFKYASLPVIRMHKMHREANSKDKNCFILAVVPYDEEGLKFLKVTQVLGQNIKLEPPNSKVKQCHRCQKWGHAQRYCHGEIKCVKCAGNHLSKKCERDPSKEPPKCANCGGQHTANYKKCSHCPESLVHKKTQMRKNNSICTSWKKPELVTMENIGSLYRNVIYIQKPAILAL